jgi:tetratricopeptide (TPR) repeat protein
MSGRARKANLIFWLTRLKKERTISLEEENSNLIRAIESGLSDEIALPLAVELLIRLHPLVMRSENINKWITYYQVAARKGDRLSPTVQGDLNNQLGALNWQLGKNASALVEFRKAQELSGAHNLIQQEASALAGVSLTKWAAHDYRNAFLEARRAVRRFRSKLTRQVVLSRLIAVKGITAYAAGEFNIANNSFREALKMPGWQDLQSQVQLQIDLALVDSNEKELYSAERRLKKLFKKVEKQPGGRQFLGKIELLRAVVSQRKGDTEVALGILERAAEAGLLSISGAERAWAESAMGRLLLKRGNPSKGKLWLKSASLLWEKLSDPWMVLDTLKIFDGTL